MEQLTFSLIQIKTVSIACGVIVLAACKQPSEPPTEATRSNANNISTQGEPCTPSSSAPLLPRADNRPITFYADILPIFRSTQPGEVYKCVSCHAAYSDPTGPNSQFEIDKIVKSLETKSMPIAGGDCVKTEYIEVLNSWARGGFLTGEKEPLRQANPY